MRLKSRLIFLALVFIAAGGCQTPPVPPEVRLALEQEQDLWSAGASVYVDREYENYKLSLKEARRSLKQENLKLGWFRNYGKIREEFRNVLTAGDALMGAVRGQKEQRSSSIAGRLAGLNKKIETVGAVSLSINERGRARRRLAQAEVLIKEADSLARQGRFDDASLKLDAAEGSVKEAQTAVLGLLRRYTDSAQVKKWKRWEEETIAESRKKGTIAIVVYKLERRMVIYRKGEPFVTCNVGLGFNGLSDKAHAGDEATPEGRYYVTKKNASSQFYKALLINYPNDEDRRKYAEAKKKGRIPAYAGIGSLVEIHGGGQDSLTRGCISLDNKVIDEVFALASVGTAVTIVGTVEDEHPIIKSVKDI